MTRILSPGAARYGSIILLLATAGLFAGQHTFGPLHGRHYLEVNKDCGPDLAIAFSRHLSFVRCMSEVEQQKAWFTFGGALMVLLLGVALMPLLPYRLLRRAGPLRPAEQTIAVRAADAARRAGLHRSPTVYIGGWRLREPFTVRVLAGTRIIVPPGLRRLPPDQIDAVLAHEMAHIRAGDVTLVWLTRGLWWALIPALAVPQFLIFVLPIVREPRVLIEAPFAIITVIFGHPYFLNYVLRSLLLLTLAAVIASSVLRSREHEADLAAAAGGTEAGLLELLHGQPARPGRWWQAVRRLTAIHPCARRRLAALHDPHRTTELRVIDAAAVGILVAMAIPVLQMSMPLRVETMIWTNTAHLTGLIAGTALALAWGLALWRAALGAELTGRPIRLRATTLALTCATSVGMLGHVAGEPTLSRNWSDTTPQLICTSLAVGGAAALSGILARAWARHRTGPPSRAAWPAIALINIMVFAGALWLGTDAASMITIKGLAGLGQFLTMTGYDEFCTAGVVTLWLLAARWSWRRPTRRGVLGATAVVLVPTATALAVRWLVLTTPTTPDWVLYRDYLAAMSTGAVLLVIAIATRRPGGLLPAMALAPAGTLLVSAAIWLRYLPIWPDVWMAARICLIGPLAMLAPAFLLAALLATVTERRSASSPGR
ncbi:M48 family metalloprotease [Actinoplanes regularis]|uniref:M48 family metalloprotease n=1 Tax=Actinoplanes regularis TaxID=52697 RepID=UPI0024A2C944|nr:M48 family metalloprotease [Actinoplanes regularis]GLW34563.1 hypothetical protein Areg01_75000 [Actinoplanes regularis]